MRAIAAALIFGAALVAGCGSDDDGAVDIVEPTSEATQPGGTTGAIEFDTDGIDFVAPAEGVPLPDGAITISKGGDFAMYRVAGATFEDLDSFYRTTFPAGQDWNDWDWCEQRGASWGSQWVFERGEDLLVVNVNRYDDEPPSVSVGTDLGPC